MKKRMGKKFKRAITVLMSAVLIAETVNCANMTVLASEGSVSAGDAIVMDTELQKQVDTAEKADEAAYAAEQAAAAAREAAEALAEKAGDAALETAEDGTYTETVSDGNGNSVEVPELKEEIDEAITEAEEKVETANEETAEVQEELDTNLTEIVETVEEKTEEKLNDATVAAEDALAAKEKAEEAAKKVEEAADQFTAEKAAREAVAAAKEAQAAADEAYTAYDDATKMLDDAIAAYNKAVEAAELTVSNGDAQAAAQTALDNAQAALDNAKTAVDAAKTEYDAAMESKATAQAAADEAAKQAGIADAAADATVENLEEKKDADVEELEAKKAAKEAELQAAKDAQPIINAEQDVIIAEAEAAKAAADAKVAEYDAAQNKIEEMEDSSLFSHSQIYEAREVAGKTTSDWKSRRWTIRHGWVYTYYTQEEIDAAKATVAEYDAAVATRNSINRAEQAGISAAAQGTIATAQATKDAAAQDINNKTTEIATITATIATVTDYIYSDKETEIAYMDKDDQDTYQKLISEMGDSFDAYTEIKNDTAAYEEATKDVSIGDFVSGIFTGDTWKKWFDELNLEAKYHGWKTQDGTYILIQNDKDNTQALITIRDDKAYIAEVDEAEFATYSATFDAVAASQAANKAAEAAAAEKAALDKYNAAVAALAAAQARLDAAKLNKLNIATAEEALKAAQKNVDDTEAEWKKAQEAADDAKKIADDAQAKVETKPVAVAYYVLNRGLTQPSEVHSYPKPNYSKKMMGELYSGVLDEATGTRDNSYVELYKKGIKDEASIPQYLAVAPTTEQLASAGVTLKEGEYITWYVIKKEGDGYHVDGIISNQRFNVEVQYGYYDGNGEFVEITKEDGTTYGQSGTFKLGESYEFTTPVIEDYVAETASVTGVATKDTVIKVACTKEATAPVVINYYRGSLTGTLLATNNLDVAVSKVEGYADTIKANWLNVNKPGDCNNGVLINYYYSETEECWVANVVYSIIPVETPDEPTPTPAPTPAEEPTEVPVPVVEEEPAPVPVVVVEPEPEAPIVDEPIVEVEEEDTPLAPAVPGDDNTNGEAQEVVNVEDEDVALAAGNGNCWIHWLILLLTAAYTLYELVRSVRRNKQIKDLEEQGQSVEA